MFLRMYTMVSREKEFLKEARHFIEEVEKLEFTSKIITMREENGTNN